MTNFDNERLLVDTRISRFISAMVMGEWNEFLCFHLSDIDESFIFDNAEMAQEFLHVQARERVYDKQLRQGFFLYTDECGDTHKYFINRIARGEIVEFTETVIPLGK